MIANRDNCEACGERGDLICCEGCPAAYHVECIEPPVKPGEVPVGAWYCNNCRKKNDITADVKRYKPVPRSGSAALGAVVDNMNKANSKAFELPRDLEDEAQAKKKEIEEDEDRVDREANAQSEWIGDGHFSRESGGSGPGTVGLVGLRHGTGSMGAGGTQLATILAAQSFQPTDFRGCDGASRDAAEVQRDVVGTWVCPQCQANDVSVSRRKPANVSRAPRHCVVRHYLPQHSVPLRFVDNPLDGTAADVLSTMSQRILTRDADGDTIDEGDVDEVIQNKLQYEQLHHVQRALLYQALPGSSQLPSFTKDITQLDDPHAMEHYLTPLFTQFLAWQRLIQINSELKQIAGQLTTAPDISPAALDAAKTRRLARLAQAAQGLPEEIEGFIDTIQMQPQQAPEKRKSEKPVEKDRDENARKRSEYVNWEDVDVSNEEDEYRPLKNKKRRAEDNGNFKVSESRPRLELPNDEYAALRAGRKGVFYTLIPMDPEEREKWGTFPIQAKEICLGRLMSCDLDLSSFKHVSTISRRHCMIKIVQDTNNQTVVCMQNIGRNGTRIVINGKDDLWVDDEHHVLPDGCLLKLSTLEFRVVYSKGMIERIIKGSATMSGDHLPPGGGHTNVNDIPRDAGAEPQVVVAAQTTTMAPAVALPKQITAGGLPVKRPADNVPK